MKRYILVVVILIFALGTSLNLLSCGGGEETEKHGPGEFPSSTEQQDDENEDNSDDGNE